MKWEGEGGKEREGARINSPRCFNLKTMRLRWLISTQGGHLWVFILTHFWDERALTKEMNETEGFQCLGHLNWPICSPLSPFCSEIFPTFSLSYWGAHSYYPRGLINGKGEFSQLPIWMRLRGFSASDLQAGPNAAYWTNFVADCFPFPQPFMISHFFKTCACA